MGSKFKARSGLVCLLGEVLDLCETGSTDAASEICETSSTDAASELFDFCDNLSWDVAAGLLLCSLGGVLDLCETRSTEVPSERFEFCDSSSWDLSPYP